jgi:hypothetical protein
MADFEALGPASRGDSIDWENFDRLYQIANGELWKLRSGDPEAPLPAGTAPST